MAKETRVISKQVVIYNVVGRMAARSRNVLTMMVADDTKRIHVGMILRAGVTAESLRRGRMIVVATDEDVGTVTVDDAFAVAALCPDDVLFWSAAEHDWSATGQAP
jgi:hypothetical protein